MGRFRTAIILLLIGFSVPVLAQGTTQSRPGDPPIASLITVSLPDARSNVTVSGAVGAVFPNAQVAVRNLYTEQIVYTNAGITGSFNVSLFATGSTPFWISAAQNIPPEQRNLPGSLPGGPGTIVYSSTPETQPGNVTQLIVDADLSDWEAYAVTELVDGEIFALRNQTSVYITINNPAIASEDYTRIRLLFKINDGDYAVTVTKDQLRTAALREVRPTARDRGDIAVNAAFNDTIFELRFPLDVIGIPIANIQFNGVIFQNADGGEVSTLPYTLTLPFVPEIDGVVYPGEKLGSDATSFYVAGALAQGTSYWWASGRVDTLRPSPGDEVTVELDVTMLTPTLPLTTVDLKLGGELGLQSTSVSGLHTNNGWSSLLTPSGLAIDNLRGDVSLGEAVTEWVNVTRLADRLIFGLQFKITIPENLPDGIYVPTFTGFIEDAAGIRSFWTDNGIFGAGTVFSRLPLKRLPLVFNVGSITNHRLYWTLLYDHPADGSRGILATQDAEQVALSNRVRFNSATYVLPPGTYPLEPYIPNLNANAYDGSVAPLIPLLFPGGRLNVEVLRPDGVRDNLGSVPILQNRLSTPAPDERTRFGAQSPIDMYRLTTLSPALTAYNFDVYGEYTINLTGSIEDKFGNSYAGGGTYTVLIAQQFDLTPGVLPGTPFEVGNVFYPGLHLAPGLPTDVTVKVRVFPLDGGETIEQEFTGKANAYGHYLPTSDEFFQFDVPGEYIIDYEARYDAADERLWAASLRSAGVIAAPDSVLLTHGRRGLNGYTPTRDEARPAWFTTQKYATGNLNLHYPFHAGDIAVYADEKTSGILPLLQIQDLQGGYRDWLFGAIPDYVSSAGEAITAPRAQDSLPLVTVTGGAETTIEPALLPDLIVNQSYGYISAVRPGVSVRQFVQGDDNTGLSLYWDADDPLNGQLGAGLNGDQLGDYVFLFGGSVIRNADAGVQATSIYAALGLTGIAEGDPLGVRVYPPYRGADGGVLLNLRDVPYRAFFHSTGTQPGQVMLVGETLSIAGQVAPTLTSNVQVTITSPSGESRTFEGSTNSIGYFYDPTQDFEVDEVGVWVIDIQTTTTSAISSGIVDPPVPVGTVPGSNNGQFVVYVTEPGLAPLEWNRGSDIDSDTPAGTFFNFTINIPPGLTERVVYRTVTMPGFIQDDGQVVSTPNTAGYQYSPPQLSQAFPALEATGRGADAAASDVVNVTLVLVGTNSDGDREVYTRTFTFMHNRIISFEGE